MARRPDSGEQRKPARQAAADNAPWLPAAYELADAAAIQALVRGDATADQQRRAVAWLVNCSGYYDLSFRPGDGGDRETAFAEGKRFVGAQMVKLSKLALSKLRDNQQSEQG